MHSYDTGARAIVSAFLPVWLAACGAAAPATADPHSYAGLPQSGAPVHVLHNAGFTVGYSESLGDPLWVIYRAAPIKHWRDLGRERFYPDPRSSRHVDWFDLRGSGFERGHMAPNYLISELYGAAAQRATFLMTNIAPQKPRLNELLWQRLEEAEADIVAPRRHRLWVTAGPIFGAHPKRTDSGVAIPVAFFRLWLSVGRHGQPRVLAFRVPQQLRGDERLDRFATSVDAIEAATGLDFYASLPDTLEFRLEAAPPRPAAWNAAAWACLPARYDDDWQRRDGIALDYRRCNSQGDVR